MCNILDRNNIIHTLINRSKPALTIFELNLTYGGIKEE